MNYIKVFRKCPNLSATLFLVLLLELDFFVGRGQSYMLNENPYHRLETLDSQGKYQLEWLVDWDQKCATFNVTVETRGYVGFGLSQNGKMAGADIVIGGVFPNGTAYFSDRHAVGNHLPELDPSQDWKLESAWENGTHTFLSFSRVFDTCDPQDYAITEDRIAVIWAYGEIDDDLVYHFQNRGLHNVHLLQPEYSPQIIRSSYNGDTRVVDNKDNLQLWSIPTRLALSPDDTTYWCTMHKAPKLRKKNHVVGFEMFFANDLSQRHTHHMIMFKCNPPPGHTSTSFFDAFLSHRGQHCAEIHNPVGPMPTEYCSEPYQLWVNRGRVIFHPPHIGQALGESDDEYFMIQTHYDNPDLMEKLVVDFRVDLFHTEKLRENEAGLLQVRTPSPGQTPSILVPPSSTGHRVFSHCGSGCTERLFGEEGIKIHAVALHAHNSGKQMRLHHFRKNVELPYVTFDDNYAFDYQQFRVLPEEHHILRGDQLTIECVYDNTWTNGTVVSGFSSRQEMCAAWIYYYNKIPQYQICGSQILSEEARQRFLGISNVTWSFFDREFVVDLPGPLAGLPVTQVSDFHVNWDLQRRRDLQKFHLRHPQVQQCFRELYTVDAPPRSLPRSKHGEIQIPDFFNPIVEYPFKARPYQRKETCKL